MDIKRLKAIAYAHWTDEFKGRDLVALCGLERFKVTEREKANALLELEKLRQDKSNSIGNSLVFVGMGMENNNLGNYRIRTYIKNNKGKTFFIELGNHKGVRIDCIVDIDLRNLYDNKLNELLKGKKYNDMSLSDRKEVDMYLKQPYYLNTKEAQAYIDALEPTLDNVRLLINHIFECNFESIEIDNHLLSCEDYISISK